MGSVHPGPGESAPKLPPRPVPEDSKHENNSVEPDVDEAPQVLHLRSPWRRWGEPGGPRPKFLSEPEFG